MPSLATAIRAWEYLIAEVRMTPEVVKKTHSILMLGHLRGKDRGHFRTVPVYIGRHEAMKASMIESALTEWCRIMMLSPEKSKDIEQLNKDLHVFYEQIHPFVDGNGRTGRMFMNWWRVHNGLPLLIIHEGEEQMAYYKWFI